ncbi:oxidoreductase domain-containing protein [Rhodopirellula maiorica SM1]|uniref:Oxidoreductase domain-containing protein n=1 Tax=Rhodopirellula maiorica SM1 TaxID=1265738 RepID=M5RQS1_9BACT|nr:Gfo/Idh/MocA family oxidoreductase [Rhodopirellula maiorica]EMI21645.1 oxidoreductase domain-containing protein [Rhodopirellula maiorica SM1]
MANSNKPKRGVAVGAGYFSHFHFDAWNRIPNAELVAICDVDRHKADSVANQYQIANVYDDVQSMLRAEQPDFIDIITRPDSHLELVRIAANLGIDVICQKPLAPTIDEAAELVDVANAAGIRLMVHENFRFQPWYREMSRLISGGVVGETLHTLNVRTRMGDGWQADAYQARQPYFATMPQLLVFETGVHFIDTFRFLAGEIEGVFASLRRLNPNIAGEDTGMILFEFASGARGLWDASRYHESEAADPRYTFGECLIETDGGSIRLSSDGQITTQKLGNPVVSHTYDHHHRGFAGDCVYHTQKHFVDSLCNATPFETSGEEYLKTLRVQAAIYQSAETGLPVRGLATGDGHANH